MVKRNGQPYSVFTPFRRAWKALAAPVPADLLPTPAAIASAPNLPTLAIPSTRQAGHFMAGEGWAQDALRRFAQAQVFGYAAGRNRLDGDGTSGLSPYLRFGMLSARQAVLTAQQAIAAAPDDASRSSAEAWLNELIWREFYHAALYHFRGLLRQAFRPAARHLTWADDVPAFDAWCQGSTGYPVVDAALRQLAATGWMHNRARMIVASLLVKDLLIDWRRGTLHHWTRLPLPNC